MSNVALYYDPIFTEHDTLDHPEKIVRVTNAIQLLETSGLAARLALPHFEDATEDQIALVHSQELIALVQDAAKQGPVMLDPDTVVSRGSYGAAVRAVGACIGATRAVVNGEYDAAF